MECDLLIKINNNNPVPGDSYVDITVPIEIVLPSNNIVCNFGCNLLPNSNTVRVYLSIIYGINSIPVITLYNIRNPQSTRPTSTFTITLSNSLGQIL